MNNLRTCDKKPTDLNVDHKQIVWFLKGNLFCKSVTCAVIAKVRLIKIYGDCVYSIKICWALPHWSLKRLISYQNQIIFHQAKHFSGTINPSNHFYMMIVLNGVFICMEKMRNGYQCFLFLSNSMSFPYNHGKAGKIK